MRTSNVHRRSFLVTLACVLAMFAPIMTLGVAAQPVYQHLRIVVPSAPGGGFDPTARAMQPVLRAAGLVQTSSVENIPGGGGTIGLARFVSAERGNPDVVLMSGLATLGAIVNTNRCSPSPT